MSVCSIGKQDFVLLCPAFSLCDPTRRTKSGFTGVRNFLFCFTRRALIQMKAHVFRTTAKHFLNIFLDSRSYLPRMVCNKSKPMVGEDLFEFLASNDLHTVEAEKVLWLMDIYLTRVRLFSIVKVCNFLNQAKGISFLLFCLLFALFHFLAFLFLVPAEHYKRRHSRVRY